jgi:hypothetical protein
MVLRAIMQHYVCGFLLCVRSVLVLSQRILCLKVSGKGFFAALLHAAQMRPLQLLDSTQIAVLLVPLK